MRAWFVFFLLAGCSLTEPSGDPLAPVQPPAPETPVLPGEPVAEEFKITSEQLQENAAEARAGQQGAPSPFGESGAPAAEPVAEGTPTGPAPTEPAAEAAPPPPPPPPAGAAPLLAAQPSPWPVRLVKTVPEAQPPRAILALPDGKELVVTPGALVAEQGLVVMSIGRNTAELVQVKAAGDHAQITPITLSSTW